MICRCGAQCCAIRKGAPLLGCRTTHTSARIALRVRIVSSSDSPFCVEDAGISRFSTSADKYLAAISNVERVRVECSKKRLKTDLPRGNENMRDGLTRQPFKGQQMLQFTVRVQLQRVHGHIRRRIVAG